MRERKREWGRWLEIMRLISTQHIYTCAKVHFLRLIHLWLSFILYFYFLFIFFSLYISLSLCVESLPSRAVPHLAADRPDRINAIDSGRLDGGGTGVVRTEPRDTVYGCAAGWPLPGSGHCAARHTTAGRRHRAVCLVQVWCKSTVTHRHTHIHM